MKKNLQLALFIGLLVLLFSCEKEESEYNTDWFEITSMSKLASPDTNTYINVEIEYNLVSTKYGTINSIFCINRYEDYIKGDPDTTVGIERGHGKFSYTKRVESPFWKDESKEFVATAVFLRFDTIPAYCEVLFLSVVKETYLGER